MATYDAVKWHTLTRQKVPINLATAHLRLILQWMKTKGLLSQEGLQKMNSLDINFELTSEMLTPLGDLILSKVYNIWAKQINYKTKPNMNILNKAYSLLKSKDMKGNRFVQLQQNPNTTTPIEEKVNMLENILKKMLNELQSLS